MGDGLSSAVGDDGDGDLGGDMGEESVRSDLEKGMLNAVTFEEVDAAEDVATGRARALDAFDFCAVGVMLGSLRPDSEGMLRELEEDAAVDVVLEQLWSFGKRC